MSEMDITSAPEGNGAEKKIPDGQFVRSVFPEEFEEIQKRRSVAFPDYEKKELEYWITKTGKDDPDSTEAGSTGESSDKPRLIGRIGDRVSKRTRKTFNAFKKSKYGNKLYVFVKSALGQGEEPPERGKPSTKYEYLGLAFSGGGIRSAAFNLGVTQALEKRGLLRYVDYLSTVSGGGYIGSCLSSVLNNKDNKTYGDSFPFAHKPGIPETAAFWHLRNGVNYLKPRNPLESYSVAVMFIRGLFLNLLVAMVYILLLVAATDLLLPDLYRALAGLNGEVKYSEFFYITPHALKLFVLILLMTPFIWMVQRIQLFRINLSNIGITIERLTAIALVVLTATAFLELQPYLMYLYKVNILGEGSTIKESWVWTFISSSVIPFLFVPKVAEQLSEYRARIFIYFVGILGPLIFWVIYIRLCLWLIFDLSPSFVPEPRASCNPYGLFCDPAYSKEYVYDIAVVVFLYLGVFLDVNKTSLHKFYRDRLSRSFIFRVLNTGKTGNEQVEPVDPLLLSRLNADGTCAPYHLVNTSINLQGSDDPSLRGRKADSFTFSKIFIGSKRTGYVSTKYMQSRDRHIDLATVMAISGAAVAPNMGAYTIRPLVFIMTLLNLRLGYWCVNPYMTNVKSNIVQWTLSHMNVGPIYLAMELLGKISEKAPKINLSDGGHFENLGIYELLRRRCKFIIASDAEADPDMTFNGLAKLIRYALIDMAIDIDIDLTDLRKDENGNSQKQCALGKIHYDKNEVGYLLYIKSSVCGSENVYINEYRSAHPAFPHESTADQFFSSTQFEAYRALGHNIIDTVLESSTNEDELENDNNGDYGIIRDVFLELDHLLFPQTRFQQDIIPLQEQLSSIEREFLDPDVAGYTYEIYPELINGTPPAPDEEGESEHERDEDSEAATDNEKQRKIFHVCNLQLQLMENVYLALDLHETANQQHPINSGWMNLFRRWADAPLFRKAWGISIGTFGIGFQKFCTNALNLEKDISWVQVNDTDKLSKREIDELSKISEKTGDLPGEGQVWQAVLSVNCKDTRVISFPVAMVYLKTVDNKNYDLLYYRIRNSYRKMKLLRKLFIEFKNELSQGQATAGDGITISMAECFTNNTDLSREYTYFFLELGFIVSDG